MKGSPHGQGGIGNTVRRGLGYGRRRRRTMGAFVTTVAVAIVEDVTGTTMGIVATSLGLHAAMAGL